MKYVTYARYCSLIGQQSRSDRLTYAFVLLFLFSYFYSMTLGELLSDKDMAKTNVENKNKKGTHRA